MNLNSIKIPLRRVIIGLILMVGVLFCTRNLIFLYLNDYAIQVAGEQFGSQHLVPEQEEKILSIAREMGITEPFTIRKMNRHALATMGYWNAFAYFPVLFGIIPLSNKPFLFMSEGFFEDLTPHEQRFLIGHELTHIQENHTLYLNLITWLCIVIMLSCIAYGVSALLIPVIRARISLEHQQLCIYLSIILLIHSCFVLPGLGSLAYRRHIEYVADYQSLTKLNCHEGCMALLRRWQKDFGLLSENPYFGFFSDHPSCDERKLLCNNLQTSNKESV